MKHDLGYSFGELDRTMWIPGKALMALVEVPTACDRLAPWQGLQQFPHSCPELFISGTFPALPLQSSATFKSFDEEKK